MTFIRQLLVGTPEHAAALVALMTDETPAADMDPPERDDVTTGALVDEPETVDDDEMGGEG